MDWSDGYDGSLHSCLSFNGLHVARYKQETNGTAGVKDTQRLVWGILFILNLRD